MASGQEQLVIEGFNECLKNDHPEEVFGPSVAESKLMLTSLARQRLQQIVRGDINNYKETDSQLESLQNK